MKILGISAGSHDAAVSLIDNEKILFAAHAERYSGIKNDPNLNRAILEDAISVGGFPDVIAYYERPWVKKIRQFYASQYDEVQRGFNIRKLIRQAWPESNLSLLPIRTFNHHLSHAAAGFQTSPFDEATVVVIDAIGEWDTMSIWSASYENGQAKYKRLWRQVYPHSIGLMYSAFTQYLGFKPNEEEYILMGMSAYGKAEDITNFLRFRNGLISDDSNIKFKNNYHVGLPGRVLGFTKDEDIARQVQELTEDLISIIMLKAQSLDTSKNLVYMGGVALNCVANRILGEYFNRIWVMPNPGDAGSSLGAAAMIYKGQLVWDNAYLGHNIPGEYPVKSILKELIENKICGVASGRAEFGPRSLGNRSILADPRGLEIKDQINEIKRRQKFRPFAPAILAEMVHDYFDMPIGWDSSNYMQVVAKCRYPDLFPAICHVDGTSRIQTVPEDGSGFRQLLDHWYYWTGCPMLLNTSLNIRGEPIVNNRADADRFEQLYGVKVFS